MQEVAEEFVRCAVDRATAERARQLLEEHPEVASHDLACRAVSGDEPALSEWLEDHEVGEKLPPLHWTLLDYICYSTVVDPKNQAAAVAALLEKGADPNTSHPYKPGGEPISVLYGATCVSQNIEVARLLLQRGANPNDGESVFHSAQLALGPMLELLVAHGGDISGRDEQWKNTPLYFLAGHRPTDSGYPTALEGIKWLLEHGADPNVPAGSSSETPLHASCRLRTDDLSAMLLEHGADPKAKDARGLTPYDWAMIMGNQRAVDLLQQRGSVGELSPAVAYVSASSFGKTDEAVEILRRHHDEIAYNIRRFPGLLVMLAENGITGGVEGLLAGGADVNALGSNGATALHYASYCGWSQVARLLLAKGASIKLHDSSYNATPTGWALEGFFWNRNPKGDYMEVLRLLLTVGANPKEFTDYAGYIKDRQDEVQQILNLLH